MNAVLVAGRRGRFLGAEELIELGQAPAAPMVAPAAGAPRTVAVSAQEGRLVLQVVEDLVAFAQGYPIEFNAYCPTDRWQAALTQVGTWRHEIDRQLKAGAQSIAMPADAVFHLLDLEKCVSAAREARLDAAKLAFTFSAIGAVADIVFGLSWIGIPAYVAGLAVLFGRPLMAKLRPEPQEPYKPALAAARFRLGDHTDKRKMLERVILSVAEPVQRYHWGIVRPAFGPVQGATCLAKGRFRVRVEGWAGDVIEAAEGWERVAPGECDARRQIAVWSPCGVPLRRTPYGQVPNESGYDETYWIEYVGPLTGGTCRVAGPFG